MARTTKKEIIGVFNILCRIMNKTAGHQQGDWCLDYAPIYGGYVIEEIMESGGISHPFGSGRRSAREMYLSLNMAIDAVTEIKHQQKTINKYEGV
jgi:hypothetical protein